MMRRTAVLCALTVLVAAAPAQTKRALILGINTYQPAGTTAQHDPGCTYGRCELGSFENLEGAVNDAQSIADVLTSPKFGFPADNVVLLTNPAPRQTRPGEVVLPADQTTHDGILAAMKKYLVDLPQPGDTVVFYDASHGSLRVNTAGEKLTVRGDDGKLVYVDCTLVPSDAYKGGYDVRDREMTRIFNAALDKGMHLTVIFDSCHSGGLTRGLTPGRTRSLPYDPRPVNDPPDTAANGQRAPAPAERADNPALVFSAVQQDQEANEADPSSDMPESHGAFTAALVETLQVLPADASASLVYQRVKAMLEGSGFANQEPDLDASAARRAQPLFGGAAGADSGKVRTAVLKVNSDSIWLDIGTLSGVGPGSEFTALSTKSGAAPMKVRIDAPLGVARSAASLISPAGAQAQVGDVFELSKLVPAQTAALKFWIGPALPALRSPPHSPRSKPPALRLSPTPPKKRTPTSSIGTAPHGRCVTLEPMHPRNPATLPSSSAKRAAPQTSARSSPPRHSSRTSLRTQSSGSICLRRANLHPRSSSATPTARPRPPLRSLTPVTSSPAPSQKEKRPTPGSTRTNTPPSHALPQLPTTAPAALPRRPIPSAPTGSRPPNPQQLRQRSPTTRSAWPRSTAGCSSPTTHPPARPRRTTSSSRCCP